MRKLLILLSALFLVSCYTTRSAGTTQERLPIERELRDDLTFKIVEFSQEETYGHTEENPIKVGGVAEGLKNERRFLNALAGPNGEKVLYFRIGSCCPFKTKNFQSGVGLLNTYSVSYKGSSKATTLYINMYDADVLKVPVGLTLKK